VSDREHVADTLQTDLDSRTKPQMKVEIVGFQLLSVSWDAQIDSKIMEAVVAFEDIKTAYAEKNISAIEADTSVFQAQIMSESVTIEATRVAAILTASKQADADIITLQGTAQSEAYAAVKSSISGLDEDALLKYVYLDQVVGGDYGKKKLSLDVPAEVKAAMDAL
jgi:regulator of protease activity HflC (stomatin/prohibitin superfamily)